MVFVVIVVVILPQHLKISHCPKLKQTARDWPKSKTCLIRQRNIWEQSSMHLSLFRWQDWAVFIFCHLLGMYLGCRNGFVCRHLAARFSQPMQSEINKLSAAREALKDTLPLVRKDNYCWSLVRPPACLSTHLSLPTSLHSWQQVSWPVSDLAVYLMGACWDLPHLLLVLSDDKYLWYWHGYIYKGGIIKFSVSYSDTKRDIAHLGDTQAAVTGELGMRLGCNCCLTYPLRFWVRETSFGSDNKLVPGLDRARYGLGLKIRENSNSGINKVRFKLRWR